MSKDAGNTENPSAAEPATQTESFHLFVYGTLTSTTVFRAVLGKRMVTDPAAAKDGHAVLAREAVLPGYKKISPDNTYLYATPSLHGRIRGFVIGPLEAQCMEALEHYEGRNYKKVRVKARTANETVEAYAFVADMEQISHTFGYEFRDHLKQEVILRGKIDKIIDELQRTTGNDSSELDRRALSELHGSTIRDLVRQHFESAGISNFYIRQSLQSEQLRDYSRVLTKDVPREVLQAYLSLVIRQVLFNQIEERLREEFRYELDRMRVSDRFYERTISALATLQMLNENHNLLEMLLGDALMDLRVERDHLIDFVRWSVQAADAIYESSQAAMHLRQIHTHMGHGSIPLGAEVEFSNIGHAVLDQPGTLDGMYHGFEYFSDFALDILMWKLGGHVDDHREKISDKPKRGFLEFAFGNLSIAANISKPITDDPWLLNQLIHQTMKFYAVRPHSVHISLQLLQNQAPDADNALPLGTMKCLFAILGDPQRDWEGRVRLTRLTGDEIITHQPVPHMLFSSVSRRHSEVTEDDFIGGARGPLVQQFKFMRLSPAINYEPIVMALKGLQIALQPGNFLTPSQYMNSLKLRSLFEELADWGKAPTPLETGEIRQFLAAAEAGLMSERMGKPSHGEAYIAYCLDKLRHQLRQFNAMLR